MVTIIFCFGFNKFVVVVELQVNKINNVIYLFHFCKCQFLVSLVLD